MQTLAQNYGIFTVVKPQNISAVALTKSSSAVYLSMKGYSKVTFIVQCGPTLTDVTNVFAGYQATDVSGTSVSSTKLPLTHYWTNATSLSTTALVRTAATSSQVTVAVANATYIMEYDAKQLNANSSFDCICLGLTAAASGGATYMGILAVLHDARYAADAMPVTARTD